ncbi:MAG: DMT family transporter [Rhodospirillales bacterium]|nr:MAG: DMT family transporter [Rhodospirillales bacterium]
MGAMDWARLIVLSLLWGGSFFFIELALRGLPPFTLVWLRVGLAAIALHLFLRFTSRGLPGGRPAWAAFFGMGLLNNAIPFSLLVWGQTQIASSLAAILNATTPMFTVLVAHAATHDERLTGGRLAGVVIGFAGVAVMLGPEALTGLANDLMAQLACLAAALSYAFAGVFGRRFGRMGVTPAQTAAGQVTASCLLLLPLVLLVDRPWAVGPPSLEVWTAVAGLALIALGLAAIDGRPARAARALFSARSG